MLLNDDEELMEEELEQDDEVLENDIGEGYNVVIKPDNVNITVLCKIADIKLSLRELLDLKTGDVLDINSSKPEVELQLNGISFAKGYLVKLNGVLGVKIIKRINNLTSS